MCLTGGVLLMAHVVGDSKGVIHVVGAAQAVTVEVAGGAYLQEGVVVEAGAVTHMKSENTGDVYVH